MFTLYNGRITLLYLAVRSGSDYIIKELLKLGSKVNNTILNLAVAVDVDTDVYNLLKQYKDK